MTQERVEWTPAPPIDEVFESILTSLQEIAQAVADTARERDEALDALEGVMGRVANKVCACNPHVPEDVCVCCIARAVLAKAGRIGG